MTPKNGNMKTEKGVIIVAYKRKNAPRYVVLKRKKNWEGWETPKGHLEDEGYEETVKEEMQEEAGISGDEILAIEDMEETVLWEYSQDGEDFRKEYRAFLVEVDEGAHVDVSRNPCDEHEHGYFFSFRDASEMVTHDNNRELLEKAHEMVTGE